jgi:hypothetical protein
MVFRRILDFEGEIVNHSRIRVIFCCHEDNSHMDRIRYFAKESIKIRRISGMMREIRRLINALNLDANWLRRREVFQRIRDREPHRILPSTAHQLARMTANTGESAVNPVKAHQNPLREIRCIF